MADFGAAAEQVEHVITLLNGLDMADKDHVRQEALARMEKIRTSLQSWISASPENSQVVEETRDQIADCRESLFDCLPMLESVQDEWAYRYRSETGGRKDEYEKLSDTLQQQVPEVYRWKRNYEEITKALDAVYRLNGQLMDLGSQLEQEHLDAVPPAAPGSVERMDTDPSPSANRS